MAQPVAPNRPLIDAPAVDVKSGHMTSEAHEPLEQIWRQVAAGFIVVPCQASGKNEVTLTPILHKEGGRTLANHMVFSFEAVQTSDGAMTAKLTASGTALKLYVDQGATQAGSGDVVDGRLYYVGYMSTLDSGAGGYVILNSYNSAALPLPGLNFIESQDFSADATADFTGFDATKYDSYLFTLQNVVPATDTAVLFFRTSSDGGVSYDAGASDYSWGSIYEVVDTAGSGTAESSEDNADTEIQLTGSVGNAAGEDGVSGEVKVFGPHLAKQTMIYASILATDSGAGDFLPLWVGGRRNASADVDAVRFLFSTGNIASGTITMYGLANA